MARLNWNTAPRDYYMGVSHGVFYLQNIDGSYATGKAWNGIRSIVETPTGGEISKIYADNMIYGSVRALEGLNGRIEVYSYPDDFALCNGLREPTFGMRINLQKRRSFGLCYRTMVNQQDYIIHLVYGINLNPGEHTYTTVDGSGNAVVHGWEFYTVPASYRKMKPAVSLVFDSRKVPPEKLHYFENILYGTDETDPRLPGLEEMLDENISYEIRPLLVYAVETLGLWNWDTLRFIDDSIPDAIHREAEARVRYTADVSEIQNRPNIGYEIHDMTDEGNIEFYVTTNAIPDEHASMIHAVEQIPNTTLMRSHSSTNNYVFNDYSITLEEEP